MRKAIIAVLLAASSIPVQAQDSNSVHLGNGLYEHCKNVDADNVADKAEAYRVGICSGMIMGIVDALDGVAFCVPPHSTYGQFIDVVNMGLASHPEERQKASSDLIVKYLRAAFPCRSKVRQSGG